MNKKYTGRYRTFAVIIALLFGVLIVQLFNLQVVDYEENFAASENKKTKTKW